MRVLGSLNFQVEQKYALTNSSIQAIHSNKYSLEDIGLLLRSTIILTFELL